MANALTHDATSGFHDIKALPDFDAAGTADWRIFAAIALVLALILYMRRRKPKPAKAADSLSAEHHAYAALRKLQEKQNSHSIDVRQFSTELSLLCRTYLESDLEMPAVESTTAEVLRNLKPRMRKVLPRMAESRAEEIYSKARSVLIFCDRVSFGDNSETNFDLGSAEFTANLTAARELIALLASQIAKERAASETVAKHHSEKSEDRTAYAL